MTIEEEIAAKKRELFELEEKKKMEDKNKFDDDKKKEEEEKKKNFFNDKKESDFVLRDPSNVMAMGVILNHDQEGKFIHFIFDFLRDNNDVKAYEVINDETFEIWKGKERWGIYSKEYFELARKVSSVWKSNKLDFYVQEEKNKPLLMAADELGFLLAPRITNDYEDKS